MSFITCLVDTGATVNITNMALVPSKFRVPAQHPKNFKAVDGNFFNGEKDGIFLELESKAETVDGKPCTIVTPSSFFL